MKTPRLTIERLKELLSYDPLTGVFTWRVNRPGPARRGSVAGNVNCLGYRQITIDQKSYLAHRLAWFYQKGTWPLKHIDHENMNTDDNRAVNIREASKSDNSANTTVRSTNKLGVKGVGKTPKGKYRARIVLNGKEKHIGNYDTPKLAAAAYAKAANENFGEFARVA